MNVEGEIVGGIGPGLCVLVGVTHADTDAIARKMADKIWNLRVFDDERGVMNRSVAETCGEVMIVSQFTLYADTSAGRRPSYVSAARPDHAEPVIETLIAELRRLGAVVATGRFRTDMKVSLTNDGPVTLLLDLA